MRLEDSQVLAVQARWLAERYERISEGFSGRAGVLLGLLAVELGALGQVQADPRLLLSSVLALLACGASLILTLQAKAVRFPEAVHLVESASRTGEDPTNRASSAGRAVIEQLLQPLDPAKSVVEQFKAESQWRARWFRRSLLVFAIAQILVAVTILNGAFDARIARTAPYTGPGHPDYRADGMDRGSHNANLQGSGLLRSQGSRLKNQ